MEYTESDLPLTLKDGEYLTLADGTSIRWESNAEAKCIFFGGSFEPDVELFPGLEYTHQTGGNTYKLTALFEDGLTIEKI